MIHNRFIREQYEISKNLKLKCLCYLSNLIDCMHIINCNVYFEIVRNKLFKYEAHVKATRIMSHIFHCIRALYQTHTNTTPYRCHNSTALAKEVTSKRLRWPRKLHQTCSVNAVTSNLLGEETQICLHQQCTKFNSSLLWGSSMPQYK